MEIEVLKKLLESGAINEETFNILTQQATPPIEVMPPETAKAEEPQTDLSKQIQAEVQKAIKAQAEENKRLSEQLESLKKEKLTAAERQQIERKEKERQLEEREFAVKRSENRLYAVKAVKAAGLDEPEDKDLEILDFVMGETPEEIEGRVLKLKGYLNKRDKRATDNEFKNAGREPQSGTNGGAGVNPYKVESWNFTLQNELELKNPAEANRLKSLAGIR